MAFDYVNNLDIDKKTGLAIGGETSYAKTTPKLGFTYDLGKNKGLYGNFSTGWRFVLLQSCACKFRQS